MSPTKEELEAWAKDGMFSSGLEGRLSIVSAHALSLEAELEKAKLQAKTDGDAAEQVILDTEAELEKVRGERDGLEKALLSSASQPLMDRAMEAAWAQGVAAGIDFMAIRHGSDPDIAPPVNPYSKGSVK